MLENRNQLEEPKAVRTGVSEDFSGDQSTIW